MQISPQESDQLLRGIVIPPRPSIMLALLEAQQCNDPEPTKIADIICQDVGLSAAMLKTVNSPFFGLPQRVSSVPHAVVLLGVDNAVQLASNLALRNTLSYQGNYHVERFWDMAALDAQVTAFLATQLNLSIREQAYTFGLFQNCGIPLLLARFKHYRDTLDLAYASRNKAFTTVEMERHGTQHAAIGYLVARCWYLPDTIAQGILTHHDATLFSEPSNEISDEVRTLVALAKLAEQIAHGFLNLPRDQEWPRIGRAVLDHLHLMNDEFEDLGDAIQQMLEQQGQE
ncbi:HDOD domain-containing protein [Chitinivorax sp. B]|uniref:HDOD domain-containing protein n=1 Tax=Chitinivorax sp. B TaxID=2502235 RepID=UPI0010F84A56|nr:HDOD domain-containing protein [Chitinivorax sp. B]